MSFSAGRILVARGRIFLRFLKQHAFVLFVLGPMIVGAVAWVGERYLDLLRNPLLDLLIADGGLDARASVLAAWAVTVLLWPSTLRELYGRGGAGQDLLDALPVREIDRCIVNAAVCVLRAWGIGLAGAALLWALGRSPEPVQPVEAWLGAALALAVAALLTQVAAASAVRLGWASGRGLWAVVGTAFGLWAAPWSWPRLLLAPWRWIGEGLTAPAARALASGPVNGEGSVALPSGLQASPNVVSPNVVSPNVAALAVVGLVALALAVSLSLRFRRLDLERARQVELSRVGRSALGSAVLSKFWNLLPRRLSMAETEQLRRDLLMIARRFSPVVSLAMVTFLVALGAMVGISFDTELPSLWRLRAMVVAGVVACLAVVSLVPFLLKAQLPVFWLEKSTGVALEHVWRTKLVLAGLLAVPAVIAGAVPLGLLGPGGFVPVLYAVLQLALCGAMVAVLVGISVFEIAEQPVLGLLLSSFVAGGVSALVIFYPAAWWLWLVFFGYFASQLGARASRRVRYTEIEL